MSNKNAAKITAILGASGCGKTFYLKGQLARPRRRRTIIWSPKEPIDDYAAMYPGSKVVRSATEVLNIVRAAGRAGEFHIVFQPRIVREVDEAQFNAVCKIAMLARNVCMVVDEIHTVTRASWAPDGWSQLVMMGRGYGAEVFALSQRPASMDKDLLGNASKVRTGRLAYKADMQATATALLTTWQEVAGLNGYQFIERDMLTGKVHRG